MRISWQTAAKACKSQQNERNGILFYEYANARHTAGVIQVHGSMLPGYRWHEKYMQSAIEYYYCVSYFDITILLMS